MRLRQRTRQTMCASICAVQKRCAHPWKTISLTSQPRHSSMNFGSAMGLFLCGIVHTASRWEGLVCPEIAKRRKSRGGISAGQRAHLFHGRSFSGMSGAGNPETIHCFGSGIPLSLASKHITKHKLESERGCTRATALQSLLKPATSTRALASQVWRACMSH